MERKLRRCSVCGNEYRFCNRCPEDKDKPNWYFAFCSENCKNIYDITSKFENGQISEFEAKEQLEKSDLSKLSDFGTSYKASVDRIMKAVSIPIDRQNVDKAISENTETTENNYIINEEFNIKKPRNRKGKNNVE